MQDDPGRYLVAAVDGGPREGRTGNHGHDGRTVTVRCFAGVHGLQGGRDDQFACAGQVVVPFWRIRGVRVGHVGRDHGHILSTGQHHSVCGILPLGLAVHCDVVHFHAGVRRIGELVGEQVTVALVAQGHGTGTLDDVFIVVIVADQFIAIRFAGDGHIPGTCNGQQVIQSLTAGVGQGHITRASNVRCAFHGTPLLRIRTHGHVLRGVHGQTFPHTAADGIRDLHIAAAGDVGIIVNEIGVITAVQGHILCVVH